MGLASRLQPAREYVGEESYGDKVAMLPEMLRRDRERWGMSIGEAGWRLGLTRRHYVALEDGERPPSLNEYEVICELYRWPDARRRSG